MWPSLKITVYVLFCHSLGLSDGFQQMTSSNGRRANSLESFENRDSSFGSNGDFSKMLISPKTHHHEIVDKLFLQDLARKSDPSVREKVDDDAIPEEELFSSYGRVEDPSLRMDDFSLEFPKTRSLLEDVIRLSPEVSRSLLRKHGHRLQSRSKRHRSAVADRIAYGFGKRSGWKNAKSKSDSVQDFFLTNIRDILKDELLKRLILSDNYDQIVDNLDALNEKIDDARIKRDEMDSNDPNYADNSDLQLPNLLRSVRRQDDRFFGGEDFDDSFSP